MDRFARPSASPLIVAIALACVSAGCADRSLPPSTEAAPAPAVAPTPRPQDDFFAAVNHEWLATTEIPADRSMWGAVYLLRDVATNDLKSVIDDAEGSGARASTDQRKIADLYASFMDEARVEALGAAPLKRPLQGIDGLRSKSDLPRLFAQLDEMQVATPFTFYVQSDAKDPLHYVPTFVQSGLGLPDRDFYLDETDARFAEVRVKYRAFIAQLLALAGVPEADAQAQAVRVLALETRLAAAQWTRVETRDPVKAYNKMDPAALDRLTPGFRWQGWLATAGIPGRTRTLIVAQPTYFGAFAKIFTDTSLDDWQAYLRFHLVEASAPYLSQPFVDAQFAFSGTVLGGTPNDLPRWKRAVGLVDRSMGFGLGKLYVARYFPPADKARIDALVANLLASYRQSIDQLDWMGPATKKEAQAKLAKFVPLVGYPKKWRDYAPLVIRRDDLLGNVFRARRFDDRYEVGKLGRPVDRSEWVTTPQTVNAFYSPNRNSIVFPAAFLRPPVFDANGDDAANYGAVGAIIGHEISHGFDDEGSRFDGDGRLREWWTSDDRRRFDAKTKALVAQYDAFEPVSGYHVNGALTLGENIADNSGLAIALKAYHASLGGKPAPVVDGRTGDQRFFVGYATVFRAKTRDVRAIELVKTDPHSPAAFRVDGTLRNQTAFDQAFDVQPGDGMYLPPEQRVTIW